MMYDQALLAMYEQALINDGTNRRAAAHVPADARRVRRRFPTVLSAGAGAQPNTLTTVSPDFDVAQQLAEQPAVRAAAGRPATRVAVGTSYSRGYNLPLISNINLINPIGRLADGRPIYSTAINADDARSIRATTSSTWWSRSASRPTRT